MTYILVQDTIDWLLIEVEVHYAQETTQGYIPSIDYLSAKILCRGTQEHLLDIKKMFEGKK